MNQQHALKLLHALYPRIWLPVQPLALGRTCGLKLRDSAVESTDESSEDIQADPVALLEQAIEPSPALASLDAYREVPEKVSAAPKTEVKIESKPAELETTAPLKSTLTVPAPQSFSITATMIDPHWGVVVNLPQENSGLLGDEYMLLSNMINAFRQQLGRSTQQVDFSFFRWPPKGGLAKSLNVDEMGLNALKGFLHKMANKQKCSWIVLDPKFACFSFQQEDLEPFSVLPKGEQHLLVGPHLSTLKADPALKKQLWNCMLGLAKKPHG